MESELRLQQSALQLNMRPCGGDTPQGENHTRREGYASTRDSRRMLYLHFPDVVPLQALDHLLHLVLHAGLMCLSHLCSHSQSLLRSVERTGPGVRGGEPVRFTRNVWLYFINAKVTSIQAWSKARITPLPLYFRNFTQKKIIHFLYVHSCLTLDFQREEDVN